MLEPALGRRLSEPIAVNEAVLDDLSEDRTRGLEIISRPTVGDSAVFEHDDLVGERDS